MKEYLKEARYQKRYDIPEKVRNSPEARAYYGVIKEKLAPYYGSQSVNEIAADAATYIEDVIKRYKVRDWQNNIDVENAIMDDIDKYLYKLKQHGLSIEWQHVDELLTQLLKIAKSREER
jgi:hypothetical protein